MPPEDYVDDLKTIADYPPQVLSLPSRRRPKNGCTVSYHDTCIGVNEIDSVEVNRHVAPLSRPAQPRICRAEDGSIVPDNGTYRISNKIQIPERLRGPARL